MSKKPFSPITPDSSCQEHEDDDMTLFSQEVGDVKPIAQTKADLQKRFQVSEAQKARQLAAVTEKPIDNNHLTSDYVELLTSNDVLSFKRDGIQEGVFKKLRMGKYQIEARLDLHKKTVEEAKREVFHFIADCFRYELRTALILHGKGDRNPDRTALLKSYVNKWLPDLDEVMAFHSAQPFHGGTGAVYVLIRKGPKSRLENKEKIRV